MTNKKRKGDSKQPCWRTSLDLELSGELPFVYYFAGDSFIIALNQGHKLGRYSIVP